MYKAQRRAYPRFRSDVGSHISSQDRAGSGKLQTFSINSDLIDYVSPIVCFVYYLIDWAELNVIFYLGLRYWPNLTNRCYVTAVIYLSSCLPVSRLTLLTKRWTTIK